jgi:serine/threonine-protein kinase RsbT
MSLAATVEILSDADIVRARSKGRQLAHELGFSPTELTLIVTAISELARNIVRYAGRGRISLSVERNHVTCGLVVVAADEGQGIACLEETMRDGFSTSGGLGLGLPGVRRLMDDMNVETRQGGGTVITVKKWRR